MTDKKAEYMARFKKFSRRKQKRHMTLTLACLLHILKNKHAAPPPAKPKQIGGAE